MTVYLMLFLASSVITEWLPPSRKANVASVLLLLAGGLVLLTGVHLPISRAVADDLLFTVIALMAVFFVHLTPKFLRAMKAAARE